MSHMWQNQMQSVPADNHVPFVVFKTSYSRYLHPCCTKIALQLRACCSYELAAAMRLADSFSESDILSALQQLCNCAGYCEEEEWIDLATVKGYRGIVMCQDIRDELMLHLATDGAGADEAGEGELQDWQKVVIAMCEGRLLPTPWLNKVILP